MKSKIVCAALLKDNIIIAGPRHFDFIMRSQIKAIIKSTASKIGSFASAEQGFIDQFGTFYNRVDAMRIVKKSEQFFNPDRNCSSTELFSEGLY